MHTSRQRQLPTALLALAALNVSTSVAAAPAAPPKLGLCASCHNADGMATLPAHPHLAGQNADYLRLALAKYKSGERDHAPMRAAVSALSQSDLDRIVDYYAALPHASNQDTSNQP